MSSVTMQQQHLQARCGQRAPFSAPRRPSTHPARIVTVRAEAGAAAPPTATSSLEKSFSYYKPVLDIEAIKGVLPHRFVWVGGDRMHQ